MVTVKNKAEGKPNIMEGRLVFSRRRQADKATLESRLEAVEELAV